MHIILIFVYTVLSVLHFNVYLNGDLVVTVRVTTAWLIFGGIQDIFLALMMFFILNDEVTVIRDEKNKTTYPVLDVINLKASHHSD
jgi:hypothetical protein